MLCQQKGRALAGLQHLGGRRPASAALVAGKVGAFRAGSADDVQAAVEHDAILEDLAIHGSVLARLLGGSGGFQILTQ